MKFEKLSYESDFNGKEFKFIIKISSQNYNHDIKKLQDFASHNYSEEHRESNESILKPFIVDMAYDCVMKHKGNNEIVQFKLSNYSQNEGSIIIKFSLFIFFILREYGAIRTGIEFFKRDFESFVKKVLPNATVSFTETENGSQNSGYCNNITNLLKESNSEYVKSLESLNRSIRNYLFFSMGGLSIFIIIIALVLFCKNPNACEDKSNLCSPCIPNTYVIEELIRKVNREDRHEAKTEELLLIVKDIQKQIQENE